MPFFVLLLALTSDFGSAVPNHAMQPGRQPLRGYFQVQPSEVRERSRLSNLSEIVWLTLFTLLADDSA
jgi:hypothetical protein